GEFAWASLRQKYPKKLLFMLASRLTGLYRGVVWHASSPGEAADIERTMKIRRADIQVVPDFSVKSGGRTFAPARPPGDDRLRVIFLSRIAREKNLDIALDVMAHTTAPMIFDIYGPVSDERYWDEC